MLFWLALCPQTAAVTTHPYEIGWSRSRPQPLGRIVSLAPQSTHPLAGAIVAQAIDRFMPRPDEPSARELAQCSFPPYMLVVAEDVTERMLQALKFWQYRGMKFHLTHIELQVLHWSSRYGVILLHHLLVACTSTLKELKIGNMKQKSESSNDLDTQLIRRRRMGLCS